MIVLLTILHLISHSFAMEESFSEGTQFSLPLLEDDKNKAITFNPKSVPGFTTPNPPEASLHIGNIDTTVATRISKNKAAQFVRDSSRQRPKFEIDAERDPLFVEADEIADNPDKTLKLQTRKQSSEIRKTHYTCLKGQDLFERKCTWTKIPKKVGMRTEYHNYTYNVAWKSVWEDHLRYLNDPKHFFWGLGYGIFEESCGAYVLGQKSPIMKQLISIFSRLYNGLDAVSGRFIEIDTQKIVWLELLRFHGSVEYYGNFEHNGILLGTAGSLKYQEYKVTVSNDVPIYELVDKNTCKILEEMTDLGRCGYKSKRCIEGAETRMIEGTPVYADCWSEEAIYQCQGDFVDNCKHYLEKGCTQTRSDCTVYQGDSCLQWEQTFECIEKPGQSTSYRLTGKDKAYCLDGDCVDSAYVANNEMLHALSQMTILRQAEKDMQGSLSIFKGNDKRCSRSCIDFKDCCGNGNGWGVSIGLSKCGQDEEQLALERQDGKCVMIGTYCANRKLGVCIKKKTSFCCFGSRLSRLLQEQGRSQLNLSFGNPENPKCRGFTPQELSRLDFSKMDLSELFEDIQKNFKPQSSENITDSISLKRLQQNMKNLSSGGGKY